MTFERVRPVGARHQQGTSEGSGGRVSPINKDGGVSRLELALVLGLRRSPPVFEYEPGEQAASSLVTADQRWRVEAVPV